MAKKTQSAKQKAYNAQRTYEAAAKRFEKQAQSAKGFEKRAANKAASRMRNLGAKISKARNTDKLQDVFSAINNASRFKMPKNANVRGDVLGEALLINNNAGNRFFAITKEIWQESEYEDRFDAIRDYFGEDLSVIDLIKKVSEDSGIDILKGNINLEDYLGGLSREEFLDALSNVGA